MYTHLPSIPSSCGAAKYATYPYFIDGKFRGKARGVPLWVDSGPDWIWIEKTLKDKWVISEKLLLFYVNKSLQRGKY